ncbi:major capsid protein [Roseiconus lacunae]|uniref:Major capsid protein n=1 Tax=Roseiconus lacunae TaxID=2605694 RepID=A0ABT7PDS3_9BACT|nr:hypothetical protein [Roseiconus lacunae]MDM4014631.1 hypothetical protein [Roseiconus lacunae]
MANSFVTTTELLQLGDGNISDIEVSELLEDAPLVAALSAIEASHDTNHEWLKKTAAPATGFRSINDGRENKKATYAKVVKALKLFDASFSIDMGLLKSKSGEALRTREAKDHLMAAFADLEKQIIYGNAQDASGFSGLADEATVDDKDDVMVVDAGGSVANTGSSVWAIRAGESAVSVVYGAGGQVDIGEEYPTVLEGSTTGVFDAMRTPILFWGGLQITTTLDVARICNLTGEGGAGLTDNLLSDLYALFPAGRKPNLFVMSGRSQKQLQQSRTATNATGAEAPFPTEAHNVPIIVTDQVSDTEALLTDAA